MMKLAADREYSPMEPVIGFGGYSQPARKGKLAKVLAIIAGVLLSVAIAFAVGAYFYWQSLKTTPQYSLALLVEAARHGDQQAIDSLVDVDAMVDDFLPQITSKAAELYGRGLPPAVIAKAERIAEPIMPAVKNRARDELPRLIRERTEKFTQVPFAAMVIGAGQYLDITLDGETAFVKSKLPEHSFEVRLQRNGDKWKMAGIRDEKLAIKIAQAVGQEIIGLASKSGKKTSPESLGVKNISELLKQAEEIFR